MNLFLTSSSSSHPPSSFSESHFIPPQFIALARSSSFVFYVTNNCFVLEFSFSTSLHFGASTQPSSFQSVFHSVYFTFNLFSPFHTVIFTILLTLPVFI